MRKTILITCSNIRKAKGQTAAVTILVLLAALMLNLWFMLSTDYKKNFDRYHDKLNAEHVTLLLDSQETQLRNFVAETLDQDARTVEYHLDDALEMVGIMAYNGGEVITDFIVMEKEQALNRPVGRAEIVEEGNFQSGIYLPMLYSSGFSTGDTVDISFGSHTVSYTVCGFLNSVMAGSHNCSMCLLMLTEDKYTELETLGITPKCTLVSVRIHDKTESESFEADLKNRISSSYPDLRPLSNSYTLISSTRYIAQMICSGIVITMAFLVTLITLVVVGSNVANYIQENMQNLGVLKAVGYKSGQILSALLLQFTGTALISALAGAGISYCFFPAVNSMMISQTGIPYTVRFLPLPFAATAAVIAGIISLTVWLSAGRIKKIEPILALRSGMETHNFKRNRLPLEKTRAPLQAALALKTTLSMVKQNVTVSITMLVLSLVTVFSSLMAENMIIDMQPFLSMVVGETADSSITISAEMEDVFLDAMAEDERVLGIYLYHSVEVRHLEGTALMTTLSNDFSQVNNQDCCIEGRFPKYDNEVAVGAKYAKEHGIKIGSEITLTVDGSSHAYIVSGFTQLSNNLGRDALLTKSGYERMNSLQSASYYLNLAEETDIDAFHDEVCGKFESSVYATVNIRSILEGTAGIYVTLITVIVIAVLILSLLIVTFVLYLLVRSSLNHKKHDYGILKALGYSTGQLVLQTALSFMPPVVLSTAVGLTVSAFLINPLLAIFLSGIGIVKCTFQIPVDLILLSGIGLILFAFAITCLLSMKVRKITPRALLSAE